jgi:hypothetical protein
MEIQRWAGRLLGASCAAVLAFAPFGGPTMAHAVAASTGSASTAFVSLVSGPVKFKAAGHTWGLAISDESFAAGLSLDTTSEFDAFQFANPPKSDFTVNKSTGRATLQSHSYFKPVATFDLTFTPTSQRKGACSSGHETLFSGNLTGSISVTGNGKGVKFSSAHVKFGGSLLSVDYNCITKSKPACGSASWGAIGSPLSAFGAIPGLPGLRKFTAALSEQFQVPGSRVALEDIAVIGAANKPSFDSKHKTLTVTTPHSGRVTGSLVFKSASHQPPVVSKCYVDGKLYKDSDVNYLASYASPSGKQLTATSYLAGKLKLAAKGSGVFDIATFKKA